MNHHLDNGIEAVPHFYLGVYSQGKRMRAASRIHASMSDSAIAWFSRLSRLYDESGVRDRAPLTIAIVSVAFEQYPPWIRPERPALDLWGVAILLCGVLAAVAQTSRIAVAIFIAIAVI